jgi:hypothetical protein
MKVAVRVLIVLILLLVLVGLYLVIRNLNAATESIPEVSDILPRPTPTIYPSATTVIMQVQALSRLETASYHVEKVITAESGQGPLGFLFGDKLLLIAYGQVIAGIDLAEFGPDDVLVMSDGTIYARLPVAEIFVATLDNERTYVYDRRTGPAGMNMELESAARQEAERLVMQAALEDGILERAEENSRDFMRSLFLGLGFESVIFVDALPTPTPSPIPSPTPSATPIP